YVSADVLELKFAVSEEWSELLNDVKDLMSQKERRAVSTEESLFLLMSEFKRKSDPVLKAERAQVRNAGRTLKTGCAKTASIVSTNDQTAASNGSTCYSPTVDATPATRAAEFGLVGTKIHRYIPAASRHKLALRDSGKCSFVDRHGKRCNSGRWVQKHHVHHFADGGSHDAENLETLCWAHHVMKHRH
ncbi:MAG: HNH endonuclease, partial [Proteobacteria bacterium]